MKIYLVLFSFLLPLQLTAQVLEPEFKFTIYAEDARGNKDSVIIGYDARVIREVKLDTRFGDKNIADQPFDSILDIRMHKISRINYNANKSISLTQLKNFGLTKQVTVEKSPLTFSNNCFGFGRCYLLVKSKYPPLKFSWDKKLFDKNVNLCISNTFMFHDEHLYDLWGGTSNKVLKYLRERSSLVDSLKERNATMAPEGYNKHIPLIDSTGKTIDTLQSNYMFVFDYILGTATNDGFIEIYKVYPNPCHEVINLSIPELNEGKAYKVNVYCVNGAIYQAVDNDLVNGTIQLKTSIFPTGYYAAEVVTDDGKRYLASFIKE
jgi:hypothetical protein